MAEEFVISCFSSMFKLHEKQVARIGDDVPIPVFTEKEINDLLNLVTPRIIEEPMLLKLEGNYVIVGDIHGNLHDLIRIFLLHGHPSETKYIFLGDYVDRGDFSLECIILLLAFKEKYPENIYLLRGNHEFERINRAYGFHHQIEEKYPKSSLFDNFNNTFHYLSLAIVLNEKYFLVHAGIPYGKVLTLEEISSIKKPVVDLTDQTVLELVWADPTNHENLSGVVSHRGIGHFFGYSMIKKFLEKNNLKEIIRGHECVNGIQKHHGASITTIFSSSGYDHRIHTNSGGTIVCDSEGNISEFIYKPINHTPASSSFYYDTVSDRGPTKSISLMNMSHLEHLRAGWIVESGRALGMKRFYLSSSKSAMLPKLLTNQ